MTVITKCECGKPLPVHLLGIMQSFTHVCSCGRAYKEVAGMQFEFSRREANPFAEYDRKHKAEGKRS